MEYLASGMLGYCLLDSIKKVTKDVETAISLYNRIVEITWKDELVKKFIVTDMCISDLPEEKRTYDIYLIELIRETTYFQCIPKQFHTKELCDIAVRGYAYNIDMIPQEFLTEELCIAAVKQDAFVLKYIPKEMQTWNVCVAAVRKNWKAYMHVPTIFNSDINFIMSVLPVSGMILGKVKCEKTYEMCKLAMSVTGKSLCYVPKEFKTTEMYEIALRQDGLALQYIRKSHQTHELYNIAIHQNVDSIGCVTNHDIMKLIIYEDWTRIQNMTAKIGIKNWYWISWLGCGVTHKYRKMGRDNNYLLQLKGNIVPVERTHAPTEFYDVVVRSILHIPL